jgi:hypothetical protein
MTVYAMIEHMSIVYDLKSLFSKSTKMSVNKRYSKHNSFNLT